ncbi:hypothetical protein AAIE21_18025 [Paenibacillus sp. 102]|uniref:hypothetical protein n=1 Tax=Paenibacillus sp. 102 TaxID=3120823 RepID=UPI0031BA932F
MVSINIAEVSNNKNRELQVEAFIDAKDISIEETQLMNTITKLDYFFYGYCIAVFIADDIYIFSAIVSLILLLSIKPLNIIKSEFLNSEFISTKETYFSFINYYFFYVISIVWFMFFPNLSALLIGSISLLTINIYIHRIAKKFMMKKMVPNTYDKELKGL